MSTVEQAIVLRLEPLGGPDTHALRVSGENPAIIGRASDCQLNLPHPHISRHHAVLALRNSRWLLTDLGSRAGTFLNGLRLQPDAPMVASSGDLVRLGPFSFRLACGDQPERPRATVDVTFAPGTIVTRATRQELDALAARRLELLMEGAAAMYRAPAEPELAAAIADVALAGTGFQRAVVLRHTGGEPDVLCARDYKQLHGAAASFSRSMVQEASLGHVVRLARSDSVVPEQSICALGIHSAVCCPIMLDGSVLGYIYLDSRGTEEAPFPDAVGFCHAVTRLGGLCLANLKRVQLQIRQTQLENDLKGAREAQTFLGPPDEGRLGHLRYVARTHPGRYVAGDLFDIFALDERRVAVCFGDVCGQGMGAAILMSAILSHVRAAITVQGDLVAAAQNINRYLVDHPLLETFATLFVGLLDREQGCMHYVDAGHGHWLVKRRGGPLVPAPLPESIVIGVERGFCYQMHTLELMPGDRLILYSDGVVEPVGADGEEFGQQRLMQVIADSPDPAADVSRTLDALRTFLGSAGLEDDTTLVSIEVLEAEK